MTCFNFGSRCCSALSRRRGWGFLAFLWGFTLCLSVVPVHAYGQFNGARPVARQVFGQMSRSADLPFLAVDSTSSWVVLTPSAGAGFAVVSSDATGNRLLGWSAGGSWSSGSAALRSALTRAAQLPASRSAVSLPGATSVLLDTPLWGQTAPFNADVPLHGSLRSQAGCVPTALSIIMAWHRWPVSGTGTTSAYVTPSACLHVPARDLSAPYDWHLMRHSYSSGWSAEEGAAVARLFGDVGAPCRPTTRLPLRVPVHSLPYWCPPSAIIRACVGCTALTMTLTAG